MLHNVERLVRKIRPDLLSETVCCSTHARAEERQHRFCCLKNQIVHRIGDHTAWDRERGPSLERTTRLPVAVGRGRRHPRPYGRCRSPSRGSAEHHRRGRYRRSDATPNVLGPFACVCGTSPRLADNSLYRGERLELAWIWGIRGFCYRFATAMPPPYRGIRRLRPRVCHREHQSAAADSSLSKPRLTHTRLAYDGRLV